MANRKLRNYLINPRYQSRTIWRVMLLIGLVATLQGVIFYHTTTQLLDLVRASASSTLGRGVDPLKDVSADLWILSCIGAGFIPLGLLWAILFTHRAAGPLHKLKHALREVRGGNFSIRVRFRKHDDFREIAELFNEAMDRVEASTQKGTNAGT